MMRKAKWLGMMSVATALVSVAIAQTPVQKLEQGGKLSFRLNDSPYYIRAGIGCNIPAFQRWNRRSGPHLQDTLRPERRRDCPRLPSDHPGDCEHHPVQRAGNLHRHARRSEQECAGQPSRVFDPPHCTYIAGGVQSWFKVTRVYADFTMEISEGSCQLDPYNCLCGDLTLAPFGNTDPPNENVNYMGFNGLLMQGGDCDTGGPVPVCARTYNINAVAYGGGLFGQGDVNNDCTIDDADLLIVLFNFGGTGDGDINRDGVVDDADLLIVLFNFGNSC
jgi:hypothetical protein